MRKELHLKKNNIYLNKPFDDGAGVGDWGGGRRGGGHLMHMSCLQCDLLENLKIVARSRFS